MIHCSQCKTSINHRLFQNNVYPTAESTKKGEGDISKYSKQKIWKIALWVLHIHHTLLAPSLPLFQLLRDLSSHMGGSVCT